MPREKIFEALTLTIPFQTIYLDMYEVTEQYNKIIIEALDLLDEGKTISMDHNALNCVMRIQKKDRDSFAYWSSSTPDKTYEMSANSTLNLLFATAPWIDAVGYEVNMILEITEPKGED